MKTLTPAQHAALETLWSLLVGAIIVTLYTTSSYLANPGPINTRNLLTYVAYAFIFAFVNGAMKLARVSTDPSVQALAVAADPVVQSVEQKFFPDGSKGMLASQTPTVAQPQPIVLPQTKAVPAPTFASTPVGTTIANGLVQPPAGDFTWTNTTSMPVSFPAPQQAPVASTSAFHDLLTTQAVPVAPAQPVAQVPQDASWLNTTPKQG